LNQIIVKWTKLKLNLLIFKKRNESLPDEIKREHSSMLKVIILNNNFSIYKESFQALIKEIKLLSDYTAVNLESFQKVSIKKS